LIQSGGELVEMTEQPYDTEARLQDLLAKYPNLLAGDQIDEAVPRRWLLISREMGIPSEEEGSDRWSLDHLFLDQDAIPTLIEVKRSTDTRIRREVIGQMPTADIHVKRALPISHQLRRAGCAAQRINMCPYRRLRHSGAKWIAHRVSAWRNAC